MIPLRWSALIGLASFLAAARTSQAQQMPPSPHTGYVFPAGGRQGSTIEVTVGGQLLQGVNAVYISGQGVQATIGAYHRPLTQREVLVLRDKLEDARKKLAGDDLFVRPRVGLRNAVALARLAKEAGITDEQLRSLAEFQRNRNDPKKQLNPQIAETIGLQITIDPSAAPGNRELRLMTPSGLTNPLRFQVSQLEEYREVEPNDTAPDSGIGDRLPVVINGQIMPGDVDRFSFTARKGAPLVVSVSARELVPYLADTVPGWFQATVALFDAKGSELAYADHYLIQPDPALHYVIPEDGQFVLEIKDALYRGRDDFVYRVTLGDVPYMTSIFPLGGRENGLSAVEAKGWNLPDNRLIIGSEARVTGTHSVSMRKAQFVSNSLPFAVDTLPERLEKEPNNRPAQAQPVTLPLIVNGRIDKPGDEDVYRIAGRAGQALVAEVYARRLNSPVDSTLTLTNAAGRQLALNDDFEDKGAGLTTHQADSRISVTLPANGTYYLTVRDAQHKGGSEYAYRMRISPPRPDFELRVVPSSINARAGASVPITVYALRRDGFTDDITLALKDAPLGFSLSGGWVPSGKDMVRLTLTVPPIRRDAPIVLQMEGQAVIQGREIHRPAVPAEDMMQAFAYRHLVPMEKWMVTVTGRGFGPAVRRLVDKPAKLPAGGSVEVRLVGYSGPLASQLQLTLSEPPQGIDIQKVSFDRDGVTIALQADAAKVKPGTKGNLIFNAIREINPPAGGERRGGGRRRLPVGTLPAIPFEIVDGKVSG